MAARPDLSPINATFSEHIHQSERGAKIILVDHFITSSYKLKQQLHSTLSGMNSTSDLATPSEVISHQRFLSATVRNIKLEAVWRQKDSNRKLQTLRQRSKSSISLQSRYSSETFNVCLADTYDQDDLASLPSPELSTPSDAHPPQLSTSISTSISTSTSTTAISIELQRPRPANEQRSSEPINSHQLAHQTQSDDYPAQQHQQGVATTSEQSSTCLPGLPFRRKKTVSFSLPPEELPDALFADEDTLHSTIAVLDQTSGLGSSLQSLEFTNPPTLPHYLHLLTIVTHLT